MAKPKKKSNIKTIAIAVIAVVVGLVMFAILWSFLGDTVTGFFDDDGGGGGDGNQTNGETDKPPVAILSVDRSKVTVGQPVFFDGNESYDPGYTGNLSNRGITLFLWNFGYTDEDGGPMVTTTTNGTTDHTFPERGIYNVTLTVVDDAEQEDIAGVTITVVPQNQSLSSPTAILIGDPLGPGVIGNSTEFDWNISRDATRMLIDISITGAQMPVTANEIVVYLEDPYFNIVMNETVNVLGSNTVNWELTASEISVDGRYNLVIEAIEGAAFININVTVTYL